MGEIRENVKNNLGTFISLKGISQKELSEKIGVSQSAVTNWIKGKNSPDIEVVAQICNVLDISVTDLFGTENNKKSPPSDTDERENEIPLDVHGQPGIFADRFSVVLDVLGMPIDILAEHSGESEEDLQAILDRRANPTMTQMQIIANALGIKLTYLLGFPVKMRRNYYSPDGKKISNTEAMLEELLDMVKKSDHAVVARILLSFIYEG